MNIFTRIKYDVQYAHYGRVWKNANKMMRKHTSDEDDSEFRKWADVASECCRKQTEILYSIKRTSLG